MPNNRAWATACALALTACHGSQSVNTTNSNIGAAEAATGIASKRQPALWAGYYMPPEWAEQAASRKILADGGSGLKPEAVAMYLRQNPAMLDDPHIQDMIVGYYSCTDFGTVKSNEVRAPAIRATYAAKFREFLRTAKPEGMAEFQGTLLKYDGQGFPWEGSRNEPEAALSVKTVGGMRGPVCTTGQPDIGAGEYLLSITPDAVPGPRMAPAAADRYLQTNQFHAINYTVHFSVPAGGSAGSPGRRVAQGTMTRVDYIAPSDKRVVATFSPH